MGHEVSLHLVEVHHVGALGLVVVVCDDYPYLLVEIEDGAPCLLVGTHDGALGLMDGVHGVAPFQMKEILEVLGS